MECPICWDTLQSKAVVSVPCGHLFHESCLGPYIRQKVQEAAGGGASSANPDCPTCRAPIKQLTKEMSKRIPLALRGYAHGAVRRVYLAPLGDESNECIREMDHLWDRLEQLHASLQESKEKAAVSERRAEESASALKQEQAKNKELQDRIAQLSSQQREAEATKQPSSNENTGSSDSQAEALLEQERMLCRWFELQQSSQFQSSPSPMVAQPSNPASPYGTQPYTFDHRTGNLLPIVPRHTPVPAYAFPPMYTPVPIVPSPIQQAYFPAPLDGPLQDTRIQASPPSIELQQPARSRTRPVTGPARARRAADIRYQHAHAALLEDRRNVAAGHAHAHHAVNSSPYLQQPAVGAWVCPP